MTEKKLPLTTAQRRALKAIKENSPAILRPHIKVTGTTCYRLLDNQFNPVINIRQGVIRKLVSKQRIEINGGGYCHIY